MRALLLIGLIVVATIPIKTIAQINTNTISQNYWIDTNYTIYCVALNIDVPLNFTKSDLDKYLTSNGASTICRAMLLKEVAEVETAFPNYVNNILKKKLILFSLNKNLISVIDSCGTALFSPYLWSRPITSYTPNDFCPTFFVGNGIACSHLEAIHAQEAWNITKGDSRVRIGVIDAGIIVPLHEELEGRVIVLSNSSSEPVHGTKVCGYLAGGTNNGIGMASISGFNTNIYFHGWGNDFAKMKDLATNYHVKAINNSWAYSQTYVSDHQLALTELRDIDNCLIVFAAGNGKSWMNTPNGAFDKAYPPSYDDVLNVSGVGHIDPVCSFNTYQTDNISVGGVTYTVNRINWKDVHRNREQFPMWQQYTQQHNETVDVVAPSLQVAGLGEKINDYDWYWGNGTSYAAPIVTGITALMYSLNPCMTPDQAENIIKNTADDIYNIGGNLEFYGLLGTGRVNAYKALLETIVQGTTYQQNITYSSSQIIYGNTKVLAGYHVTTGTQGNVIVPAGVSVKYDANYEVELAYGFEDLSGNFEIRQKDSPCY